MSMRRKMKRLTCPSGDTARYRTRKVWPVRVASCKEEEATVSNHNSARKKKKKWRNLNQEHRRMLTLDMVGYFQTTIWFWEYPCVLTSSFTFLDQAKLHTCTREKRKLNLPYKPQCWMSSFSNWSQHELWFTWLLVSTQFKWVLVVVFQKRIHLSAVPPPEARSP